MSRPRSFNGALLVIIVLLIVLFLLAVGALAVRTTQPRAMVVREPMHSSMVAVQSPPPSSYRMATSSPPATAPSVRTWSAPREDTPYVFLSDSDVLWRQWTSGKRDGPYCPNCYQEQHRYLKMQFAAFVSDGHGGLDEQWTCNRCSFTRSLSKTLLARARP
jgi:hypothetical protein